MACVDNACQTQEIDAQASNLCQDHPHVCLRARLDIVSLKSQISDCPSKMAKVEVRDLLQLATRLNAQEKFLQNMGVY